MNVLEHKLKRGKLYILNDNPTKQWGYDNDVNALIYDPLLQEQREHTCNTLLLTEYDYSEPGVSSYYPRGYTTIYVLHKNVDLFYIVSEVTDPFFIDWKCIDNE